MLNKQRPLAEAPQAPLHQHLLSTHTCWKLPPVFCKCHPSLSPTYPQAREPMTPCDRGPERLRVLPEATQLPQEKWAEAKASHSKVPAGHVCPTPPPAALGPASPFLDQGFEGGRVGGHEALGLREAQLHGVVATVERVVAGRLV